MIGEATLPEFAVEIVSSFMVADSWISGLGRIRIDGRRTKFSFETFRFLSAPFDDLIVLLAVPKKKEPANFGSLESSHEGRDDTIYKPHLVIAEPKKDGNILIERWARIQTLLISFEFSWFLQAILNTRRMSLTSEDTNSTARKTSKWNFFLRTSITSSYHQR